MASSSSSGKAAPPGKLDLTSIQSYSPHWPHALRLTLAIAVQYACQRCVDRAEAVHQSLYPTGDGGRSEGFYSARTSSPQKQDKDDLAGLVLRDEDGNVQGQLQGWARTQQVQQDREMVEAWRDYAQKYLLATCQHLGISSDALPPGPTTLEDILAASRGRPKEQGKVAAQTEYEMGTSHASPRHEGTGERDKQIRAEESEDGPEMADPVTEAVEGTETQGSVAEADLQTGTKASRDSQDEHVSRQGGILDEDPSREIEVVNELLLIALGMGQHRGEDGSTTLFEQEALFGDLQARPAETPDKVEIVNAEKEGADESELVSDNAGTKAWGALRSGVASIGKASKNVADKATKRESRQGGPTKPNEMCHYDARARAVIFIAVTAMDVRGLDMYMAEKVVAQTIYFIMTEGRTASKKGGKGDPLDESRRHQWMNSASHEAVERDKSKTNWAKWAAMGAGAAVGGALIGVTGGLAAPLVAPALVGLTGISFLATTGGVVMMATLLGVSGAGLAGYRVQRRLRGIDHFEFHQIQSVAHEAGVAIPSLHATICCPGLQLNDDKQGQAFDHAFYQTPDARDAYIIHAEEEMMKRAGEGLRGYVLDTALKSGGQRLGTEVLKHTAMAGIAALTLPLTAWTAASAALDGVFVQAKSRAYRAGLILADVLRDEVQGHRPVTLIGTSLGCVTILTALGELSKSPSEHAHLVDSVFLVGAPFSPSPATLRRARSMVARRFVTAYSSRDMVCAVAAWLGSGISLEEVKQGRMPRIVGSRPVLGVPGVENVDVSDLVGSHFSLNDGPTLERILQKCRAQQG